MEARSERCSRSPLIERKGKRRRNKDDELELGAEVGRGGDVREEGEGDGTNSASCREDPTAKSRYLKRHEAEREVGRLMKSALEL